MAFFSQVAGMNQVTQKNSYIALYTLAISGLFVFLLYIWQGSSRFKLRDEIFLLDDAQRTYYLIHHIILGNIDPMDVSHIPAYKVFKARGAS